jgi:hypothetical protein
MPVLLSFVACEAFLWLLVLRFGGGGGLPIVAVTNGHRDGADVEERPRGIIIEDEGDEEGGVISVSDDEVSSAVSYNIIVPDEDGIDVFMGVPREETDDGEKSYVELARLQAALDEGFARLVHYYPDVESSGDSISDGETVNSICGDVWAAASGMLSSKYLNDSAQLIGRDDASVDYASTEAEVELLKSLTLGAQHCLGGAGMAFLSPDGLDHARMRITTRIFDGLVSARTRADSDSLPSMGRFSNNLVDIFFFSPPPPPQKN